MEELRPTAKEKIVCKPNKQLSGTGSPRSNGLIGEPSHLEAVGEILDRVRIERSTTFGIGASRQIPGKLTVLFSPSSGEDSDGAMVTLSFQFPDTSMGRLAARRLYGEAGTSDMVELRLRSSILPEEHPGT